MVVDADPVAGTVTMRLARTVMATRVVTAVVLGLGAPLAAERWLPSLLVPALLVTAASAALVVVSLGHTVVIDDVGITLDAARRRPGHVAWAEVDGCTIVEGHLVVVRTDGRRVRGPTCGDHELARALEAAALLGLLPRRP